MTQGTASGGRAGRRADGQEKRGRAGWSDHAVEAALAKPEQYLDRHTPTIFTRWWKGWVSIAPGLLCSNLK